MNSFRIGMNSFRIKLSKVTILPFSFLLQLPLRNWKLSFPILSLHKKFYFLALFVTPNSSIYPEWFHSGSEWIHSDPERIHSGTGFFIVSLDRNWNECKKCNCAPEKKWTLRLALNVHCVDCLQSCDTEQSDADSKRPFRPRLQLQIQNWDIWFQRFIVLN